MPTAQLDPPQRSDSLYGAGLQRLCPYLQAEHLQSGTRDATQIDMMMSRNTMWGLIALAAGAGVAAVLMPQARNRWREAARRDDSMRVDEASEDSFPASDPPSFSAPAVAVPGPTS
jgi:hypothetical protein